MKLKSKVASAPAQRPSWMILPEIEKPSFTESLRFPDDVTACSLSQISLLHAQYTALFAYATAELAKSDIMILRLKSEQYVRKNNIQRSAVTHRMRKTEADAQVRLDMTMQNLVRSADSEEEKAIFLRSRLSIFDKYVCALSREMTRRTSEIKKI